mmetsp:Transcript_45205/g.127654  ORF Transcript_45205/g.127654 Transcript_45205/m.127654 type:complete len:442 (-) Transcript_45205:207-1532(-)
MMRSGSRGASCLLHHPSGTTPSSLGTPPRRATTHSGHRMQARCFAVRHHTRRESEWRGQMGPPEYTPRRIIKDNVFADFASLVGNTPLVRLNTASLISGCQIYGKCEYANPGGSVKDRPAVYIIRDGEERGLLGKTVGVDTVVEGSAGNTAIGLALMGFTRLYKTVCVIPNTQSPQKKDLLRQLGVQLVEVPPQKVWHPNHFVKLSGRLAERIGGFWANQFDNVANRRAHYETTGPEIWEQMEGRVDAFVSSVGTGGTLAGVGMYLKEKNPRVKICLADVPGAVLHRYYTTGEARAEGSSITENIGQGRVTANLEGFRPDFSFEIPDYESVPMAFQLLEAEGLPMGFSSGVNVAAAIRLAEKLGPNKRIATVLCDTGFRYANKQYNPEFLSAKDIPYPEWLDQHPDPQMEEKLQEAQATQEQIDEAIAMNAHKSTSPDSKV